MASRTISTGEDVDAALAFLGRQKVPQVNADAYFMARVQEVIDSVLKEADEKRFSLVKELMDEKDKGQSISKLRELLGI